MSGWDRVTEDWLAVLARRGRADGTRRAYRYALHDFGAWMVARGVDIDTLDARDVEGWQDSQIARDLAPRTRQSSAHAVRGALRWAAQRGLCGPDLADAVETPKAPKLLPRPLARADVDRIQAYLAPRRPRAPLYYWRTRALFFYMVTTAARVSEVLSLDRADLEAEAVIVTEKGGYEHVLWAPAVAMRAVDDYLARRNDPHPALWVTHGNPPTRRLAPAGVREGWHQLADRLGIPRFTTHQIRHTAATELLDAGVSPEVVAAHLGHHGLASLAGYGEVRRERRQLAIDAMQERFAARKPAGTEFVVIKGGRGRRTELV